MVLQNIKKTLKFTAIATKTAALGLLNKQASRQYLLATLGSLPGLSAKLGQFISMRLNELEVDLHKKLEPMGIEEVKAILLVEAPQLCSLIDTVDPEPKVASLGQVHRVILNDGRELAVKVQFSGIDGALLEDFDWIFEALGFVNSSGKSFDRQAYFDYMRQGLADELNYEREAALQERFRCGLARDLWIHVPCVYEDLSSPKVLVQEYLPGASLDTVCQFWPEQARRDLAWQIAELGIESFFSTGYIHGDPHPGNWGFLLASPERNYHHGVVLYDFGAVLELDSEHLEALNFLVQAYQSGQSVNVFDVFCYLGFDGQKLSYIAPQLPALVERLLDPLLSDGAFDFSKWSVGDEIEKILAEDKWWFRTAGPPWFLQFMRSAFGFFYIFKRLKIAVPLKHLYQKRIKEVSSFTVPHVADDFHVDGSIKAKAQHLYVEVLDLQTKRKVVSLTMPARAVDQLEDIMPAETRAKIEEQHDLQDIKSRCQRSGYASGELFFAKTSERSYKVWLEGV